MTHCGAAFACLADSLSRVSSVDFGFVTCISPPEVVIEMCIACTCVMLHADSLHHPVFRILGLDPNPTVSLRLTLGFLALELVFPLRASVASDLRLWVCSTCTVFDALMVSCERLPPLLMLVWEVTVPYTSRAFNEACLRALLCFRPKR